MAEQIRSCEWLTARRGWVATDDLPFCLVCSNHDLVAYFGRCRWLDLEFEAAMPIRLIAIDGDDAAALGVSDLVGSDASTAKGQVLRFPFRRWKKGFPDSFGKTFRNGSVLLERKAQAWHCYLRLLCQRWLAERPEG